MNSLLYGVCAGRQHAGWYQVAPIAQSSSQVTINKTVPTLEAMPQLAGSTFWVLEAYTNTWYRWTTQDGVPCWVQESPPTPFGLCGKGIVVGRCRCERCVGRIVRTPLWAFFATVYTPPRNVSVRPSA